jgi:hypothetical protein
MKRTCVLVVIIATSLTIAAPTNASHIACGQVISTSGTVTLDSDVICPSTTTNNWAVRITANDVRLNLAGHTIRGGGGQLTGILGTTDLGTTLQRLVIRNGTVEGFPTGVYLKTVDSQVRKMSISGASGRGIDVISDGSGAGLTNCERNVTNCIIRNTVSMTGTAGVGINTEGPNNNVWGNTVRGTPHVGIGNGGDGARVTANTIESCIYVGIGAGALTTYTIVWGNTVLGCTDPESVGVNVFGDTEAAKSRVRFNTVTGTGYGITVIDRGALVADNDSSGNAYRGIWIESTENQAGESPPNIVRNNNADNNGEFGIHAYPSPFTFDGGGNTASGNGVQDCVNVSCSP